SLMKRPFSALLVLVVVLACVMAVRAWRVTPPLASSAGAPAAIPAVDTAAAAEHLAGAVKFPTVSLESGGAIDTATFLAFHEYLATTFPRVHTTLARELVAGLSLLYT